MMAPEITSQPEPMTWRAAVMRQSVTEDVAMRRSLLAGDEAAFAHYVSVKYASLLRVANCGAEPERAAQHVEQALCDFCAALDAQGSQLSLDGLLFQCLVRCLRRRAEELGRPDPFAADEPRAPSVPQERFRDDEHRWSGGWVEPPKRFTLESAAPATLAQAHRALAAALDRLPPNLRVATFLRDVQGLGCQEICAILEVSETSLRDALNRGRAALRAALEMHLSPRARAQEASP